MGKTRRNIRRDSYNNGTRIEKGGDAQVVENYKYKKLAPYTNGFHPKFEAEKTGYVNGFMKGVSESDKLITKNANRSLKKGLRQKLKRELRDQLLDLELEDNIDLTNTKI